MIKSTIDVIVPVYNVEDYITTCIENILAQTFTDFTLVLVDDGSKDRSLEICEQYAKKDKRIHVLSQENRGAAAARNAGLDWVFANTHSEWLCFMDSDDAMHPETLQILLNANLANNTKVSACSFLIFDTPNKPPMTGLGSLVQQVVSPEAYCAEVGLAVNSPWGMVIYRELFRDLRFPVGIINEDMYIMHHALFAEDRMTFISEPPLYYYFVNVNSVSHCPWSKKKMDFFIACMEQLKFFHQKKIKTLCEHRITQYYWELQWQREILRRPANVELWNAHQAEWKKHRAALKEFCRANGWGFYYFLTTLRFLKKALLAKCKRKK